MTCDVCFVEPDCLLKRLDDPEGLWYCQACSPLQNKRILNAKQGKKITALVKRDNGNNS